MQRFEITIDGVEQPGDFATKAEADAALENLKKAPQSVGKQVLVREKGAKLPITNETIVRDATSTAPGHAQNPNQGQPATNPRQR